jgi:CheY-like chemotaxis protein
MKVLVIDDEQDVRYVARLSLGHVGGMTVIEAASGAEGIARAREDKPDIILLDLMMPGMDGGATFRALREDPLTSAIPVIFLTAAGLTYEVAHMEDLGAKGVLLKPFDPMTLARDIRTMLGE